MSNEHEQGRGGEQPHEPQLTPEQQLEAMQQDMRRISERVEFLETRNQALEDSNAQIKETLSGVADRLSQRDDEELQGMASELRAAAEGAVVAEDEEAAGPTRRQRVLNKLPGTRVHNTQPRTAESTKRRRMFGLGAVAVGAVVAAIAFWPNGDSESEKVSAPAPTAEQRAATKKAQEEAVAAMNGNTDVTRTTEQARANASATTDEAQGTKRVDQKTWREASTVNRAVMRMDSTPETIKQHVHDIFDSAPKDVSHLEKMQSRLQGLTAENASRYDLVEATAFAANSDYGNALAQYNALHGKPADTPSNASHQEMQDYIENFLTADSTHFEDYRLNGFYANTGQHNSKDVFTQEQHFDNVRSMRAFDANGRELIIKAGGGNDGAKVICTNVNQKINEVKTPVSTPVAPPAQGGPEDVFTPAGTPDKPEEDRITSKPVSDQPRKPKQPTQPRPVTPADKPKTPEKPQTPPSGKDHNLSPVSSDPNHPEEEKRPNIENPGPAIQPIGAPAEDPYKPPQTVEPPAGVGPTPENPATPSPATGQNNGSETGAPAEVPAP